MKTRILASFCIIFLAMSLSAARKKTPVKPAVTDVKNEEAVKPENEETPKPVELTEELKQTGSVIESLARDVEFLASRNIEMDEIKAKARELREIYAKFISGAEGEWSAGARRTLAIAAESLSLETRARVIMTKRLELLYLILLCVGVAAALGIFAYLILLYIRRDRLSGLRQADGP
jgi:TolA-binding protein